jgi:hypothetical protein
LKAFESDACSNSESEPDKGNDRGKQIIDAEPNATIATTKIQKEEPKDPEEAERLFHSKMWVKGSPLQFIVDSRSQKNLISVEVVKWLGLQPQHTHNHTPSDGCTKDRTSASVDNVTFPTTSSPSRMRYYVTLLLLMFLMYY